MCFNIISKQKSKQTSNIFKKNPWPAQEITAKKHKTIMFSKLLDSREKTCLYYIYFIYIYTCNTYIYMLLQLLLLLVVFFLWCDLALTGLYHLSILIFGSQGSKATCSNLHLALDHLITSNSFTYPKLSRMF
jgi:hypothetical protein